MADDPSTDIARPPFPGTTRIEDGVAYDISGRKLGNVPDNTPQSQPAPPGMTVGWPSQAPPQPAQPSGAVPAPPGMTVGAPHTPYSGPLSTLANVASGVGGGVFETAQGAKNLVNRLLPNSMQIPDIPAEYRENVSPAEKVGGFLENIGEFVAGDEVLKGLMGLTKIPPNILALAKQYPNVAKMLVESSKAAAIGGAQGAVQGAAEGKPVAKEAETGAIAGGAGGAIGEVIGEGAAKLGKIFFNWGKSAEEAMMEAGRPYMSEATPIPRPNQSPAAAWTELTTRFQNSFQVAKNRIIQAAGETPIKKMNDFIEVLYNAMRDIREKEFNPMIAAHSNETISLFPVWMNIRGQITRQLQMYGGNASQVMDDFATKFMRHETLGNVADDLEYFNSQLKEFYKMSLSDQAAELRRNPIARTYETIADGLRDALYQKLDTLPSPRGVQMPPGYFRKINTEYGALKDLMRVFGKRAAVFDRQAALNLAEVRGFTTAVAEAAGAIALGHPWAALGAIPIASVPIIAKEMNKAPALINLAIREVAGRPSIVSRMATKATGLAPTVAGAVGALGGRSVMDNIRENEAQADQDNQ